MSVRCLLACALMLMAATPGARATDWIYHLRPTDNIWTLSRSYLKPGVSWQQLQAYNHIADPYHLAPGTRLRLPVAWLIVQPARAKVVALIGHAQATEPGRPAQPVRMGMSFGIDTQLSTDAGASLTLQFADGSRTLLLGDSRLSLDRLSAYGRTGMVDTRLRLQRGRISNEVMHQNGMAAHFSVATPSSISSVRGTHFRVAADGSRQARTEVLRGHVDVGGDRRHVMVNTGRGVVVAAGRRPGRVQPLLDPPSLHCPQAPITRTAYPLTWDALRGAADYRVQVAPGTRFEALVVDRTVAAAGANLPDLPDGSYLIRVHGIDARQLEGEDASCAVTISAHPHPPAIMAPQAGSKVHGTRPAFRWTESTVAASYAWQLASDADFAHLLDQHPTLTGDGVRAARALPYGRYYWRIASRDRAGKLGPYSDPLPFELVPAPPAPALAAPSHTGKQLKLGWQAGLPGQRYRIQLARASGFGHPWLDRIVAQPLLEIGKPGHGVWYMRVRTIDTDGYAGPWSPTQKIKLPCLACRIAAVGGGAALLWLLL